jgi:hypothetical protein
LRIDNAVEKYLEAKRNKKLADSTIYKLRNIFESQFLSWAKDRGYRFLSELTPDRLVDWQSTWKDAPLAASKKYQRVVGFFYFCIRMKWIDENPMKSVDPPKVKQTPTLPFDGAEIDAIVSACDRYPLKGIYREGNRKRLRAMVLLLRYWVCASAHDIFCISSRSRQIGESNLLDFLFPEPRFNAWCVGEFHVLDPRIIPNGRRDHFETNAPFHDLLNHLTPIARSIATRCRTSSVLRKWERDFDQLYSNASRNLAVLRQNVANDEVIEESRAVFESPLETMQKIAGREQVQPAIRRRMQKRIASLRRRASLPREYPASISRLPSAERRAYGDCFELIYECSEDKAEARSLIDRMLRRLARRPR